MEVSASCKPASARSYTSDWAPPGKVEGVFNAKGNPSVNQISDFLPGIPDNIQAACKNICVVNSTARLGLSCETAGSPLLRKSWIRAESQWGPAALSDCGLVEEPAPLNICPTCFGSTLSGQIVEMPLVPKMSSAVA